MKKAPQRFARQLAFTALFALGAWHGAHAADAAGHIQTVVGSAKVYDAAGKERDIKRGDEIRPGDRIVTGDQSLVQVKFTDGAYVSVRTNTDLAIEQYRHDEKSPKESGALLKLARGALRSITGAIGAINPDSYRVVTPTATIGIRGTDHEPVFIPQPKAGETPIGTPGTYDKVNSGATIIRATTGEINIRPGQTGFVPAVVTTAPTVLPRTPDFFKNLDPSKEKGDKSASNRGEQGRANAAEASDGRSLQRGESGKDGTKDSDKRDTANRSEQGRTTAAEASDGRSLRGEATKPGATTGSGDGDKTSRTGDSQRTATTLSPLSSDRLGGGSGTKGDGGETRRSLSSSGTTLAPPGGSGDRVSAPTTTNTRVLSPATSPIRPMISPTAPPSPNSAPSPTPTTTYPRR